MSKRLNVRRLLRKHRSDCMQRLDGISMYEEPPYSHDMRQIINACEDDIRMIDKIVFTFFENQGDVKHLCVYNQDVDHKCMICGCQL